MKPFRRFGLNSLRLVALLLVATCPVGARGGAEIGPGVESEICVYGGTSGGVIAAVQAARMGRSVVLVEPGQHVGGMSSGGLSLTDHGNIKSIGGVSLEFYRRVGQNYGYTDPYWVSAAAPNYKWYFDPGTAEAVYKEMLAEEKVPVYYGQQLISVIKTNQRVAELRMSSGLVFRARMFIDTTYEGDLMAGAGVSFVVGRESRDTYGESLAGVVNIGNGGYNFDPYVQPGNPSSGLLPFVSPVANTNLGAAGPEVQAYNYRLCVTQVATNQIPIHLQPPEGYSEARYELLARYIQARIQRDGSITLKDLLTLSGMTPNRKVDVNNGPGGVSTDYVGESRTWATNTSAGREAIKREHENYIRGLLYYLANASAVPAEVRSEMRSYGLARDEFMDNGGWPDQLYVREARRMVSDYVMQQHNSVGRRIASDSIGLASYSIDSHACQRFALNGVTVREGGMFNPVPRPFPISYRSIVPRSSECDNLFVTFALGSSHVAFGACRMEPVFMITSQSAATAACLALAEDIPVQELGYEKLAAHLTAQGQILAWDWGLVSTNTSTNSIVIDNSDPGVTVAGNWTVSTGTADFWGANYLHDGDTGAGKGVTFTTTIPSNGVYEVDAWWTAHGNRATNALIEIIHGAGKTRVLADQTQNGGVWVRLLRTNFATGAKASVTITNGGASGYVIADAVRFAPVAFMDLAAQAVVVDNADPEFSTVGDWLASTSQPGYWGVNYLHDRNTGATNGKSATFSATIPGTASYRVQAWWTANPNRASNVAFDITHPGGTTRAYGNQRINGSTWTTLLTTNFSQGFRSTVTITNQAADGYVIADAVRFIPETSSELVPVVQFLCLDSRADVYQTDTAEISIVRSGDTANTLRVNYSLGGTARNGQDYETLPGTILLPPGVASTNILIVPIHGEAPTQPRSVVISLGASSAYRVGAAGDCTVWIFDSDFLQAPRIMAFEASHHVCSLYFAASPSAICEIQRAPSLGGPWEKIGSVLAATSGSGGFADTNPPAAAGAFYRLSLQSR